MAVTIQKISELSGVSRVLHGRPNVNPMIREKVVRAAEKLGYQPPVPPKSAACRQAAILIPQWTDGHFNRQIVSGIRKALRYIADPAFILTEQPLRTMTMQELLRAMDEQIRSGVDGLIIRAENTPEVRAAIEQAVQQGVTVITYDADVPHSGRLCHAGQNLVRAGAIAAGVMARLIRPPEHVLIVTGNLRMEAHKGRVKPTKCLNSPVNSSRRRFRPTVACTPSIWPASRSPAASRASEKRGAPPVRISSATTSRQPRSGICARERWIS